MDEEKKIIPFPKAKKGEPTEISPKDMQGEVNFIPKPLTEKEQVETDKLIYGEPHSNVQQNNADFLSLMKGASNRSRERGNGGWVKIDLFNNDNWVKDAKEKATEGYKDDSDIIELERTSEGVFKIPNGKEPPSKERDYFGRTREDFFPPKEPTIVINQEETKKMPEITNHYSKVEDEDMFPILGLDKVKHISEWENYEHDE